MMKLQTPVADEPCKVGISYEDKIMMLGSCFTDNIGRQLVDYGFDVCVNPFGTLYNPVSILRSVERLISGTPFTAEDCVQIGAGDTRWCSFSHHTSFARASREEFLEHANMALKASHEHFLSCTKVIITLGTSWCFRHKESDAIVSNCLKHPASEFFRERLSAAEVTDALRRIVELCCDPSAGVCPKQFIFTVSPIRHFKDGAHGNQISKSALLLGIDDLLAGLPAEEDGEQPSHKFLFGTPENEKLKDDCPEKAQDSKGRDPSFDQHIKHGTNKNLHGISSHSSSLSLSARCFSVEGFSWLRYTICSW